MIKIIDLINNNESIMVIITEIIIVSFHSFIGLFFLN